MSPTAGHDHEVVVATGVTHRDGRQVPCPAAPLLVGSLRRGGITADTGHLDMKSDVDTVVSWFHGDVGLAAAVPTGSPVEPAVRELVAATGALYRPRSVVLASPRSFCAGVERAIETVERVLDTAGGAPVYVRKQIVHNSYVVAGLERRGAVFVDELDEVPDGATVVFSAHGVSPAVRDAAARRGMRVIDATCPLVTKVHAEARRFAARGDTIVLIGHDGHEEVAGTMGEAPENVVLVETVDDVSTVDAPDPGRVSYLTQTTLAVDETATVVDALRERFPALREPASEDICYATTNRQRALAEVVDQVDLVLVVGSANSSNSVRLMELSRRRGKPAHLIDGPGDLDLTWLDGVASVGLAAGASAPPVLVDRVIDAVSGLGPVDVREHRTARELVHFGLPSAVRKPEAG